MKGIVFRMSFVGLLLLTASIAANATIETIKGSLTCFVGCNKNVVQLVAQGEDHSFEVVGQFVDVSTAVQVVSANGVSVSYGTRKGGSNSSIIVRISVQPDATLGERTIRMRYAIETNGPDTFKVRVVRRGRVDQIRYRRPVAFPAGFELVAPTDLPINTPVQLVVTGTRLDSIEVGPQSSFRNVRVLPGATATQATIELESNSGGQKLLLLYDAALSSSDMNSSTASKFSYEGGSNRNITFSGQAPSAGFVPRPIGSVGSAGPALFVDAAPRANMLNVFRRQSQNAAFTENGVQYFSINSEQFCNGMVGTQSRIITVPNPVWGVSNVGTANIAAPFASQLRSGGQVLDTQVVPALNTGATQNFNFARQNSQVRVFTFLTRNGCFVSPTADRFFEDPPFTVVVNTNGALVEAAANTANNTRNY